MATTQDVIGSAELEPNVEEKLDEILEEDSQYQYEVGEYRGKAFVVGYYPANPRVDAVSQLNQIEDTYLDEDPIRSTNVEGVWVYDQGMEEFRNAAQKEAETILSYFKDEV